MTSHSLTLSYSEAVIVKASVTVMIKQFQNVVKDLQFKLDDDPSNEDYNLYLSTSESTRNYLYDLNSVLQQLNEFVE